MSSFRLGLSRAARQVQLRAPCVRSTRRYASDNHGHDDHGHGSAGHDDHHHHTHDVKEDLGLAFYVIFGAIPAFGGLYYFSRPGKDGQPHAITKWLQKWEEHQDALAEKNALMTAAIEQAAHDKHLFYYADNLRSGHYEMRYPELLQHGSHRNVPAGTYIRLDQVVEVYRKQHLDEEERKAKKLAASN
ncbi:NADH dehydrogenase 17.8K chain [Sordaria brevicollis]|uniref:NADH dehydrogenase 17.8K chain n=1 Tax=Sordaria brevicollis TaxID=83679 RepID=A0AAE0UAZ2_SORBR|nr:NADH dehydrogenase 17.8K chain [Sordaria brevicollis]